MSETGGASFWSIGLSGLIGVAIGAGGTFYAQKQATTAENEYFMALDQMRLSIMVSETMSFEEKQADLNRLQQVRHKGFRLVFDQNIDRDLEELDASLARISEARARSEAEAEAARQEETQKAAAAAQDQKVQAVRTNPLIMENCGRGTTIICP
ncbi:hypothetical protein ACN2XU_18125 [Primorskyibacter sp. 2E107]|uniref:hypothetical protein n=1 Tax=Primorskyibacter sp. 2E107 TaxID=3403458 RepID=UPI003AF74AA4